MSLARYKKKRDFKETREPSGKVKRSKKGLIFVVQKHDASHLHYDFRLEMEGVLRSWAVPKGPSLDPSVKRLAMEVEDHPYDYKDFEGEIPEGNYGAGDVIVWDNGQYLPNPPTDDPDKEARRQYHKGHLSIVLLGKKLKGEFGLIRTNREDKNGARRQWLLIKADDKFATDEDVTEKTASVISRKKLSRDRK
ncbi:MAG: 3'-phosphoesterase [Candidatus Kaiserbacteria bacterium]|nr:3'-phosphoesterase [Candidatus Kaiserbacteria bacterium]